MHCNPDITNSHKMTENDDLQIYKFTNSIVFSEKNRNFVPSKGQETQRATHEYLLFTSCLPLIYKIGVRAELVARYKRSMVKLKNAIK